MNNLEQLREECIRIGWKFSYRNRSGKKYVTVNWSGSIGDFGKGIPLVEKYFPRCIMTSGSYREATFRINPDYLS